MDKDTTVVTALFDIDREKRGDGRRLQDYFVWLKKTLKLKCNLYIVTEEKFKDFIVLHRDQNLNTKIKITTLNTSKYYKYLDDIKRIINNKEYKKRISYPNRVECTLPEYNIIQYSKFGWLEDCIVENPFESKYFFWIDAGIS